MVEDVTGVHAPVAPERGEVRVADLRWEYDWYTVDVSSLGDPPGSVSPRVVHRRRVVGPWVEWEPSDV